MTVFRMGQTMQQVSDVAARTGREVVSVDPCDEQGNVDVSSIDDVVTVVLPDCVLTFEYLNAAWRVTRVEERA